jgi:hypothetical protein
MDLRPIIRILMLVVALILAPLKIQAADEPDPFAVPAEQNSEAKDPGRAKSNDFSRGSRNWLSYASAAGGDAGKGEMYSLHVGYGVFLRDRLSVNIDVLGAYIRSGLDDNGVAAGLDLIFRRHFSSSDLNLWTLFVDIGGGLQQQSTDFAGSRRFNFRLMGGGGGTVRVADSFRLMGGIRYLHISDAGIEGGGGGFDGFQYYAGAIFPF